jgi:hypothetical protein
VEPRRGVQSRHRQRAPVAAHQRRALRSVAGGAGAQPVLDGGDEGDAVEADQPARALRELLEDLGLERWAVAGHAAADRRGGCPATSPGALPPGSSLVAGCAALRRPRGRPARSEDRGRSRRRAARRLPATGSRATSTSTLVGLRAQSS